MKNYKACLSTQLTLKTCERYGKLASKYEEAYKKYGYKIYKKYANFYKKRQSKCQTIVNKEGTVVGQVILDNGGNGKNRPLANIEVSITDSKGKVSTVRTNKRGYYFARHIARGEANVTIVNPQYQNKTLIQSIGVNPSVVNVKPFRRNWAKRDGYSYVTSLALQIPETSLNKGTSTTVEVTGTYSNGTTRDDTNNSIYSINPSNIASISEQTLTALSDGNVNITAKIDDVTSNVVSLEVYWEVDGHRLPPQPDEQLNNSTLLGIDTNNNGVRDDVERFVYEKEAEHPTFPKTWIGISMQTAKAHEEIINNPVFGTRETLQKLSACRAYFVEKHTSSMSSEEKRTWLKANGTQTGIELVDAIYNTKERILKRFDYLEDLSGRILEPARANKEACDVDLDGLGE